VIVRRLCAVFHGIFVAHNEYDIHPVWCLLRAMRLSAWFVSDLCVIFPYFLRNSSVIFHSVNQWKWVKFSTDKHVQPKSMLTCKMGCVTGPLGPDLIQNDQTCWDPVCSIGWSRTLSLDFAHSFLCRYFLRFSLVFDHCVLYALIMPVIIC
jgi:hypothetical protein